MQPYSKDHHHGLLLGWKLRTGHKKGIGPLRMRMYSEWFYETHLKPHFELEEKYLFPVLGNQHELVIKALDQHREIHSIMKHPLDETRLMQLADVLEAHIRFEERELFGQIQAAATEAQLAKIKEVHDDTKFTEHSDEFWK